MKEKYVCKRCGTSYTDDRCPKCERHRHFGDECDHDCDECDSVLFPRAVPKR